MSCYALGVFQSYVIITYATVKLTVMTSVWDNQWVRVSWLMHTSPQMSEKMLCHAEYMPYLELLDWDFRVAAANRPGKTGIPLLVCMWWWK